MKLLFAILFCLLFAGCEKDILDCGDWVLYEIPAGKHNQLWHPLPYVDNQLVFEFYPDTTWLQTNDPSGVNKICGIYTCYVHWNSCRLGFQYIDSTLLAYAYIYTEKERFYEIIDTLQIDTYYKCKIVKGKENYHLTLEGKEHIYPCAGLGVTGICLPYIGGDDTFENNFTCWLKFII